MEFVRGTGSFDWREFVQSEEREQNSARINEVSAATKSFVFVGMELVTVLLFHGSAARVNLHSRE